MPPHQYYAKQLQIAANVKCKYLYKGYVLNASHAGRRNNPLSLHVYYFPFPFPPHWMIHMRGVYARDFTAYMILSPIPPIPLICCLFIAFCRLHIITLSSFLLVSHFAYGRRFDDHMRSDTAQMSETSPSMPALQYRHTIYSPSSASFALPC